MLHIHIEFIHIFLDSSSLSFVSQFNHIPVYQHPIIVPFTRPTNQPTAHPPPPPSFTSDRNVYIIYELNEWNLKMIKHYGTYKGHKEDITIWFTFIRWYIGKVQLHIYLVMNVLIFLNSFFRLPFHFPFFDIFLVENLFSFHFISLSNAIRCIFLLLFITIIHSYIFIRICTCWSTGPVQHFYALENFVISAVEFDIQSIRYEYELCVMNWMALVLLDNTINAISRRPPSDHPQNVIIRQNWGGRQTQTEKERERELHQTLKTFMLIHIHSLLPSPISLNWITKIATASQYQNGEQVKQRSEED